jgi:hypothetical protein
MAENRSFMRDRWAFAAFESKTRKLGEDAVRASGGDRMRDGEDLFDAAGALNEQHRAVGEKAERGESG